MWCGAVRCGDRDPPVTVRRRGRHRDRGSSEEGVAVLAPSQTFSGAAARSRPQRAVDRRHGRYFRHSSSSDARQAEQPYEAWSCRQGCPALRMLSVRPQVVYRESEEPGEQRGCADVCCTAKLSRIERHRARACGPWCVAVGRMGFTRMEDVAFAPQPVEMPQGDLARTHRMTSPHRRPCSNHQADETGRGDDVWFVDDRRRCRSRIISEPHRLAGRCRDASVVRGLCVRGDAWAWISTLCREEASWRAHAGTRATPLTTEAALRASRLER